MSSTGRGMIRGSPFGSATQIEVDRRHPGRGEHRLQVSRRVSDERHPAGRSAGRRRRTLVDGDAVKSTSITSVGARAPDRVAEPADAALVHRPLDVELERRPDSGLSPTAALIRWWRPASPDRRRAGQVELLVVEAVVLERLRPAVEGVSAVAAQVAELRRRQQHVDVEPAVEDRRRHRMDPRTAVGPDRREVAESGGPGASGCSIRNSRARVPPSPVGLPPGLTSSPSTSSPVIHGPVHPPSTAVDNSWIL